MIYWNKVPKSVHSLSAPETESIVFISKIDVIITKMKCYMKWGIAVLKQCIHIQ